MVVRDTNIFNQEINLVTARREFCGPNKAISIATMEGLDSEIDTAKSSGDRKRKKDAKKQLVMSYFDPPSCTNTRIGRSFS